MGPNRLPEYEPLLPAVFLSFFTIGEIAAATLPAFGLGCWENLAVDTTPTLLNCYPCENDAVGPFDPCSATLMIYFNDAACRYSLAVTAAPSNPEAVAEAIRNGVRKAKSVGPFAGLAG